MSHFTSSLENKNLISSTVIHAQDKVSTISYGAPPGDRTGGIEISSPFVTLYGDEDSNYHPIRLLNNQQVPTVQIEYIVDHTVKSIWICVKPMIGRWSLFYVLLGWIIRLAPLDI